MNKPIYILGTGLSHDGSACLLRDGEIAVAIEKERVTRLKHDGGNDSDAIRYCLEAEGINLDDLTLIVQNANFGSFEFGNTFFYGKRLFNEELKTPIITISHHLAHAYNAIGTSPFEEMAVLVIDGCGSLMDECIDLDGAKVPESVPNHLKHIYAEKDSYYLYQNNRLMPLYKDFSVMGFFFKNYPMHPISTQHSIGGLYGAVSEYIFSNMMDAGKLMGLAPYGKPGVYDFKVFNYEKGRVFVNYDWMKNFQKPARSSQDFKDNFQYYADIAYWIQKSIEEAVIYLVQSRYNFYQHDQLAYTGGVALNAVANGKILSDTPFKDIYITPAAGDNGLAVGCAYYGWLEILKKKKITHGGNIFFGKVYSSDVIQKDIELYALSSAGTLEIYKQLTTILPDCLTDDPKYHNEVIQFTIADLPAFFVHVASRQITFEVDSALIPQSRIYASAKDLLLSLVVKDYYQNCLYRKTIVEFGRSLYTLFDQEKVINKILELTSKNHRLTSFLNITEPENLIEQVADLLAAGKTVGWFQDGSEFGPRSLGQRSILADPRNAAIRDFINEKIKFREDFRPFAPSVLKEKVADYFEMDYPSPYMIMTAQAKDSTKQACPGIVHADGSSRIQTVTPEWNHKYYQLIVEFMKKTNIPILLNTSFNKKGMPIVETPLQAITFFFDCALDCLVLNNFLILK